MNYSNYQPDGIKYVYGKSERWPVEKVVVKMINDIHEQYPAFKLMLLGTTGVHGEKFPLFFTRCIFRLPDSDSLKICIRALKDSDELIRRRIEPNWNWEFAWQDNNTIMFFVNWFDFAYFMKNKEIFLGKDHSKYAMDFGLNVKQMEFDHFKIFKDGSYEKFDLNKITDDEKDIVKNLDKIEFSREFKDKRF